jgi:molecular chaperone GrpE
VNDEPTETVDDPVKDIEELREEVGALNERLLRVRADTDNYRKRLERTTDDLVRQAKRDLYLELLSLADDLERALRAPREENSDDALVAGVKLTLSRLQDVLASHGVRAIDSHGLFDPNMHEAVGTVPSTEAPDGHIVSEVSRGYLWGNVVLRAARVQVAVEPKG